MTTCLISLYDLFTIWDLVIFCIYMPWLFFSLKDFPIKRVKGSGFYADVQVIYGILHTACTIFVVTYKLLAHGSGKINQLLYLKKNCRMSLG